MIKTVTKNVVIMLTMLLMVAVLVSVCGQAMAEDTTTVNYDEELSPEKAADFINRHYLSKKYNTSKFVCYKDAQGANTYCIRKEEMIDGKPTADARVYTRSKNGARNGCEVVSVAWNNGQRCLFCSLLSVAYKASDKLVTVSMENLAGPFRALIVVIFAIWLGIRTLNHVSFLTSQDAAKYLTEILTQAFKFLLAYFALYYTKDGNWPLFDLLIKPIFEGGLDFANYIINGALNKDVVSNYSSQIDTSQVANNMIYESDLYQKLEAFTLHINEQFALLQALGKVLRCLGGKYLTLFNVTDSETGIQFGLGFNCLIYGLLFGLLGFLLSLAFVFYLFDAVVELGVFGAVLPFAIACWPFEIFTKASGNAVKLFMNSTFTFMMAGVAVSVCMQLVGHALGATNSGDNRGIDALVQAVDTLDVEKMKELLSVISINFLVFAFAGFGGFMMVGKVASLTNTFAGGGLSSQATSVATMGASAVTGAAKKITKPTTEAVGKKLSEKSTEAVSRVANSKVGKFVGNTAKVAGAVAITGPVGAVVVGAIGANKAIKAIKRRRAR